MTSEAFPAWVDGRMVAAGEPAIAADDQGLLLGLSVFDTLLYEAGCLYFQEAHLERLSRGAEQLGIRFGPGRGPAEALGEYLAAFGAEPPDPVLLRLTATRGRPGGRPTLLVTARRPEALPPGGVTLALASVPKAATDHTEGIKSTNRLRNVLAFEEARARGAWEALFTTTEGELSEGTISNLFLVFDGPAGPLVKTPALSQGCLAGTTRELLLGLLAAKGLAVEDGVLTLDDLARADEGFLTNTSQRVVPIARVLGTAGQLFPTRLVSGGPTTRAARQAIAEAEARYAAAR